MNATKFTPMRARELFARLRQDAGLEPRPTTRQLIQRNFEAIERADNLLYRFFTAGRNGRPAPDLAERTPCDLPHNADRNSQHEPKSSRSWLAQWFSSKTNCKAHRLARWLSVSPQFKRLD